ncbi:group 1 glycosyl transferase [Gloeomargarita lithophora Alchichica-D10]|uniref:Group 1 glycosyl transferase n=1 Tax=Gloeomargarita lithophora Alchichica-D10 TaxID=1188229 RepID=A0A1J0AC42_9CYAN|nr:glycosyltransferase family 1 protein [Gloeomargarita lithophora]APB33473.1 group 1 glycosyl transferase [Gloeomargarita lithophora Alchichica-D10]
MRIALFTETFLPKIDGIVTRLSHTIRWLGQMGDEVLVFAPAGAPAEYCGAKVVGVTGMPLPMYPELKLAWPHWGIGQKLREFQPHVVHVVNPAVLGVGGVLFSKWYKLPLVASYHTHLPRYLQHYGLGALEGLLWALLRAGHNQAQLNLCTSTAMIQELHSNGIERLALWQRGVDTELFHPGQYQPETRSHLTQGHPEAPLFLYVGRLSAEKEIERLRPLLTVIPSAHLALVGDGPHREQLQQYFSGTNTHFIGYLQGAALAQAFAVADVFVFPSCTETLGLVLLEAMATGCPVVAARRGGITDVVQDGVHGFLYEPEREMGLVEAVQQVLASPTQRHRLQVSARQEAERWGWDRATAQLRQYYRQVAAPC